VYFVGWGKAKENDKREGKNKWRSFAPGSDILLPVLKPYFPRLSL
jgi:hypothetical protein